MLSTRLTDGVPETTAVYYANVYVVACKSHKDFVVNVSIEKKRENANVFISSVVVKVVPSTERALVVDENRSATVFVIGNYSIEETPERDCAAQFV